MSNHPWRRAVILRLPHSKRDITVTGPLEAAAILADKWPETYGFTFQRALAACASEMAGHAAHARTAFVDAARAIGAKTTNGSGRAHAVHGVPHRLWFPRSRRAA